MFEISLTDGILFSVNEDEFIEGAYHIFLIKNASVLSELHLVPLFNDQTQFFEGDFYQKTFASHPVRLGYGSMLLTTLLANIKEAIPTCRNIYSSSWIPKNNFDETDFITEDAVMFWTNLVQKGLAERVENIARYKILK